MTHNQKGNSLVEILDAGDTELGAFADKPSKAIRLSLQGQPSAALAHQVRATDF